MNNMQPLTITVFLALALFAALTSYTRAEVFGDFTYQVVNTTVEITDYIGKETNHLDIPAMIEGKPVTSLAASSISLAAMTSVTIPATVETIGDFAFTGCINLTSVVIPASVNTFGIGPFYECHKLKSVVFQGTNVTLGGNDFARCFELDTLTLPSGLTAIPAGCFLTTKLQSIEIPDTVTTVGNQAFKDCDALTYVRFSSGMTEIPEQMFADCDALTRVFIPGFIGTIGKEAFSSCSALISVTIPDSVTTIRERAFEACAVLNSAVFLGSAPTTFLNGTPGSSSTQGVFRFASTNFTVFFAQGAAGFASPSWMGYPSTALNVTTLPPAPWLVAQGLPLNSDMSQSLPGSGVTLLAAYAFQLDPRSPDVKNHPAIKLIPGSLDLIFYGTSPGISYSGEASTNLESWTTTGITMSVPNVHGKRTLTLPATAAKGFIRARAMKTW
jgi:hypothetical protein